MAASGTRLTMLFSFPNPVNEVAARTVASGVVVMATVAVALGTPWLLVPIAYGFCARVLTGPTLSPLGQFATRIVVPHLPFAPRPTPGPPKRFAQGMGVAFSTAAVLVWVTAGWSAARWVLVPLDLAAFLEAAFGLCLGCRVFAVLMRLGVIPEAVCIECADLARRHRRLASRGATG
jgi:Domain of unknown function (DUF4395)